MSMSEEGSLNCPNCGCEFTGKDYMGSCTMTCSMRAYEARKEAEAVEYRERLATLEPDQPGLSEGICEGCGEVFHQKHEEHLYCSPSCRQKAYRRKKRAT